MLDFFYSFYSATIEEELYWKPQNKKSESL